MCVERAVGRSHNVRSWPIDVSTNNCMHATGSARLISVCVRACSRIHPLRPFPTCMLSIWRDHVRLARRAPGGHNHRRSLSGINPSIAPPLRPRVQEMLQEVPRAATDASAVPSVGLGCFCCLGSCRVQGAGCRVQGAGCRLLLLPRHPPIPLPPAGSEHLDGCPAPLVWW